MGEDEMLPQIRDKRWPALDGVSHCEAAESSSPLSVRSVSLPDIIDIATVKSSPVFRFTPGTREGESWKQRKDRIESALTWVRSELNFIRAQDKALLAQLQQCQRAIDKLKRQRINAADNEFRVISADDSYWEDWEISEFDRKNRLHSSSHSLDSRKQGDTSNSIHKSLLVRLTGSHPNIRKDVEITV